jgi:phosphoserine phosphatase
VKQTLGKFRLVTLDLDGTMFQGNSILYLNRKWALEEKISEAHSNFAIGEITERELNEIQIPFLIGMKLTPLLEFVKTGPLLRNIREGIAALHEAGLHVSMLTFNPLQALFEREFGIDVSICNSVEIERDEISKMNTIPENKIKYLERHCQSKNIALSECIHVGDGPNDIQTFRAVGFSIALNSPFAEAKRNSSISLETTDFSIVATSIIEKCLMK